MVAQKLSTQATPRLLKQQTNGSTKFKQMRSCTRFLQIVQFIGDRAIHWRFNLRRAPWWGGQFERLIGLFKRAFYKAIRNNTLSWEELSEVVLDVEVALNNRPLSYIKDDVELPVLTPKPHVEH